MTHFNPKQICKMAKKYDRLEGIICGMIVGDALGVTNEFNPIQHPKDIQKRMAEEKSSHQTYPMQGGGNFRLPVGNWSDDASMGLCLIEGLLAMEESDKREIPFHAIMDLFYDWWSSGHNNGGLRTSVGLGGVISKSLLSWEKYHKATSKPNVLQHAYQSVERAQAMEKCDGNGSIMRGAGAAIFARSEEEAMRFGYHQSLITTPGYGSANCSRLLSYLCYQAMTVGIDEPEKLKCWLFSPENLERFLTLSRQQPVFTRASGYTELGIEPLPDNVVNLCHSEPGEYLQHALNWRVPCSEYQLNPDNANPGYYGSYTMDGMSLALHILYNTHSFEEALEMTARLCGDADSNAAVVGQLAGAIYGADAIPKVWLDAVNTRCIQPKASKEIIPVLDFVRGHVVELLRNPTTKLPSRPIPPSIVLLQENTPFKQPALSSPSTVPTKPQKHSDNASLYWIYLAGTVGIVAGAVCCLIGILSWQLPLLVAGAALLLISIRGLSKYSFFKKPDVSATTVPSTDITISSTTAV